MIPEIRGILRPPGERGIMWTKKSRGRGLASVILEYLLLSVLVSLFTYLFLYTTAVSIGENYLLHRNIVLTELQGLTFHTWIRSICVIAAIIIFTVLFLFMLGQRLSYLITIMRGIEMLQENEMNYEIPLEGNDELTQLAESINYLSAAQRELARREAEMKDEREAWIRSLSHDIRTPLTSLLSYSEFMAEKESLTQEEMRSYIDLVYTKSCQIRELSSQLMERKDGNWENIDDIRFLLEQLAQEWMEVLEDRFDCSADLSGCESFSGAADIYSLRRILDNLASNVEKYANPSAPVTLAVQSSGRQITLTQTNRQKEYTPGSPSAESHNIGLSNIRSIAALYSGSVTILSPGGEADRHPDFRIEIILNIRPCL